ncbi:MAG: DNA alkylation repair protein [Alphaproteobacteria bacterium]|nr:DNA alkylation repair protein [Alphaproteobacteria bacterium]
MIETITADLEKIKRTAFGISVPELRKYAKKIAKENCRKFLDNNSYETFELKLLHAFVIGYAKDDIEVLLDDFRAFIPHVDSWGICDSLCQNFKIAREFPETVWDFLTQYKNSKKEFESRIVSVMLLSHYLNDDYVDKVIAILDELNTDDYYSQMGVAWAIATIMGKYPEKCFDYLKSEKCHLDRTTYRMAFQKIRESFRVSDEIKLITKGMKK